MFLFVSIMRVPDEGCSRNASRALSLIYSFYYMHVLHTVRFQHRIVFLPWKLMMTYEWNQNNHTSRMTSIFPLWISFSYVVTSHQLQHITDATILQSMYFLWLLLSSKILEQRYPKIFAWCLSRRGWSIRKIYLTDDPKIHFPCHWIILTLLLDYDYDYQ